MPAAKHWRFQPADLAAGDTPRITLIVPVAFHAMNKSASMLEGWRAELAGPSHPIPWLSASKQQFDPSGLKDGQSLALDNPVKLICRGRHHALALPVEHCAAYV